MTFRVGQKVVCVDAAGASPGRLVLNEIYTVKGVARCPGNWRGKPGPWISLTLYETEAAECFNGFCAQRFRPVVSRPTDISIFTKMLLKESAPALD